MSFYPNNTEIDRASKMRFNRAIKEMRKIIVPYHIPTNQRKKWLAKRDEKIDIERGLIEDGLHK